MGNSKKNKKKTRAKREINRKTIITVISVLAGIILIVASVICVRVVNKRRADRTVRIAFYGLDDNYVDILKSKIPVEEDVILKVDILPKDNLDSAALISNYDMLFTWRGELTDALHDTAENIPSKILETMPRSFRDKKCVPIFLDHYEIAYNQDVLKKTALSVPETFSEFDAFLKAARGVVFSPFFCNGSDDRSFIDFIGAIVMANAGLSGYNKLIDGLRKAESLNDVLNLDLDGKGYTLNTIIEMLKKWPKDGYTHPSWYNGNQTDLVFFATDKQLACFFTSLSEHRKIAYNVVRNYESSFVPMNQPPENYGLIAPAVSCMLLSDNSNCKRYLGEFFTEDAQSELSNMTNLAPVHYTATADDIQADDVRFWAASCAGGAVPDLYLAVYQRDAARLHSICSEIKAILR